MNDARHPENGFSIPPAEEVGSSSSEGVSRDTADGLSGLPVRVQRLGEARGRAVQMLHFLRKQGNGQDQATIDAWHKLQGCAEYLGFRHYLEQDAVRLHTASFCKQHLICPVCAIRRGSKAVGKYVERLEIVQGEASGKLAPWMLTYTVRNGADLAERMAHLRASIGKLVHARRQERSGAARNRSTWGTMAGAVGSYEVTNKGKGWHPHVHVFGLFDGPFDHKGMRAEWKRITGDSHVCEAHPVFGEPADAFCEVFKYALKFSEMDHIRTWEAAKTLARQRLVFSLGVFRGVEIPENLTDDALDGPWVEYFYRYLGGGRYGLSSRS